MNRMNSHSHHQRQSSTGSSLSTDPLQASFSSLDNFLNSTKLMEDEIMVPSKLKEKIIESEGSHDEENKITNGFYKNGSINGTNGTTNGVNGKNGIHPTESDVYDHYKFIRLVRNQFLHSKPFTNVEDYNTELKDKNFKKTFDELSYHYNGLMMILDHLSHEAKTITEIYRESV